MPDEGNQRAVHEFLVQHLRSQGSFTRQELQNRTDWNKKSFDTYWSKHYRPFILDCGSERYRVTEAFRRYASWPRFQQHVTQMRRASTDYISDLHEFLIIYEFFMPLTHEESLRNSLDALFYRDMILTRVSPFLTPEVVDGHGRAVGELICNETARRRGRPCPNPSLPAS